MQSFVVNTDVSLTIVECTVCVSLTTIKLQSSRIHTRSIRWIYNRMQSFRGGCIRQCWNGSRRASLKKRWTRWSASRFGLEKGLERRREIRHWSSIFLCRMYRLFWGLFLTKRVSRCVQHRTGDLKNYHGRRACELLQQVLWGPLLLIHLEALQERMERTSLHWRWRDAHCLVLRSVDLNYQRGKNDAAMAQVPREDDAVLSSFREHLCNSTYKEIRSEYD